MKESYDADLYIEEHLSWGMLKYGLCSYFALAYHDQYPNYHRFVAIMEYDEDLEKEYLVHILMIKEDRFLDAEGVYVTWKESIADMTDVEFMDLSAKEVDKDFVRHLIEEDIGFESELYESVKNFVSQKY